MNNNSKNRIEAIDGLRGFAIVAILLLHNLEHFDLYFLPEYSPEWLKILDTKVWEVIFFLFIGKAYSIFAILFGFTFYLQQSKQKEKGNDFSGRFAWRLVLLFGFGMLNTTFYVGDILLFYAVIGFILIPFANLKTKYIIPVILFLLLQPAQWVRLILEWNNYSFTPLWEIYGPYFESLHTTMKDSSLFRMVMGNYHGKIGHLLWFWSDGRVAQTAGLFLVGLLLGRYKFFYPTPENIQLWKKIILFSIAIFIPLYFIPFGKINPIINSWSNLFFTAFWISVFLLLYQTSFKKALSFFVPIGRMSLSTYIMQSLIGSFIYYGYGLGLYQYTGATLCMFIAILFCIFQWMFSKWWLSKYKQGPLEKVWHTLTWI